MRTDKHRPVSPAFAAQRLARGALPGTGRSRQSENARTPPPEACLKGRGHLRSGGVISQIPKSDGGDKRAVFCKSEQVVVVQFCVFYWQGSATHRQRRRRGSGVDVQDSVSSAAAGLRSRNLGGQRLHRRSLPEL